MGDVHEERGEAEALAEEEQEPEEAVDRAAVHVPTQLHVTDNTRRHLRDNSPQDRARQRAGNEHSDTEKPTRFDNVRPDAQN